MKKINIFNIMLALIVMISACDKAYDDIYDEIDKDFEDQDDMDLRYSDKAVSPETYTMSEDDYSALKSILLSMGTQYEDDANSIGNYKNFSNYVPAKTYLPYFLDDKFFSYTPGTEIIVSYAFYRGQNDYIKEFDDDNFEEYELVAADYDAMGEGDGEPGKYDSFSSGSQYDYLPSFLATKYPSPSNWDFKKIQFVYYSGGNYTRHLLYYFLDGEWKMLSDGYVFATEDYESLGDGYGEPGQYNNFSSDLSPNIYIPVFLKTKYPTAIAGDMKQVVYKYFSTSNYSTTSRIKEFVFDGEGWAEYQSTIEQSALFKFTYDGWLFVPPLKFVETTKATTRAAYELTDADYELVGDGKYHNFTLSEGGVIEKISKILKANFNDLAAGDVLDVTYKGYDGGVSTYTIRLEVQLDE